MGSMQYSIINIVRSINTSIILSSRSGINRRCLSTNTLTSVKRDGTVEHITLSNPKTRNALSLEMMKQLTEDIARAGEDKSVRTIVLRGEGKELTVDTGYDYHMEVFHTCEKMMLLIGKVPVPVVGVVTGLATAAGCQMIASCDLVVATPD